MVFSKACTACGGTGTQAYTRCPACHGRQLDMFSEALTVTLPPGLQDGARAQVLDGLKAGDKVLLAPPPASAPAAPAVAP